MAKTHGKECKTTLILISDDEDQKAAGYRQFSTENNSELTWDKNTLVATGNVKIEERHVLPSLMEREQWKSDPTFHFNNATITFPIQRKRKGELDSAVDDFSTGLDETESLSEAYNKPMVTHKKPEKQRDDLKDHRDAFSLVERTKVSRKRTNTHEACSNDTDIAIHPRHAKEIRPHQLEGFNLLVRNLVADKPGGCILAHAPGSGKTFMLISFIQGFLARYPSARPLVVLPKGILGSWKGEFERWQVEDIPLYDFYSVGADNRAGQLEVLKSWNSKTSILFLGYKQFTRVVSDDKASDVVAACRDMLLKVPTLLILDEGHTPRTKDTEVLKSLCRVQTPRKVVLSGTLFQNHVVEVFNILDLVRPGFLTMDSSQHTVRLMMSQVSISSTKSITEVSESVENTLLNDDNFTRKVHVIRNLRELTKDVLHYYKGEILDELPGLSDFSVFLELGPKQKDILHKLKDYDMFKRSAVGSALYIHPCLSEIPEVNAVDRDAAVDTLVKSINVSDGVKARFFLNILSLANSAGEKLLAFSQYMLPMKFLEKLLVKEKGWHVGKEIFMISGETGTKERSLAMDRFNGSADAKVLFGSIKACGEGISLVGASRVIVLDVHLNPSVTRQAIGRAFRPGQQKKVFVYRLVAADSPEEKTHETAFKKEFIQKLWFEWSESCSTQDFKLNQVNIDETEDQLLGTNVIRQDIKALYRR
ncbi:hypothetical protein GUJ93_ZPchr0008g12054 [Zizania palustris]|uniref:Uncharacterized protein n=1 Tax=Zizania palustris TaxID=103762 RepID=A0A8J5VJN4_ZIZPA|nr:hypothetical protein GUJ93_ZPchr0008g12054 [Zizania palustris]